MKTMPIASKTNLLTLLAKLLITLNFLGVILPGTKKKLEYFSFMFNRFVILHLYNIHEFNFVHIVQLFLIKSIR